MERLVVLSFSPHVHVRHGGARGCVSVEMAEVRTKLIHILWIIVLDMVLGAASLVRVMRATAKRVARSTTFVVKSTSDEFQLLGCLHDSEEHNCSDDDCKHVPGHIAVRTKAALWVKLKLVLVPGSDDDLLGRELFI